MIVHEALTILTFVVDAPASAAAPLRLHEPPGPATVGLNLPAVRNETNPSAAQLGRTARIRPRPTWCLFDVDAIDTALPACRRLAHAGVELVAVRGRCVPESACPLFAAVAFHSGLQPLLDAAGLSASREWIHPVLLADVALAGSDSARFGVVCSVLPEPGLLSLADVGRAGRRPGAAPVAGVRALEPGELDAFIGSYDRAGAPDVLLLDTGGDAMALAEHLLARGRLGGWFGPACRPVPAAVRDARTPIWLWFEPEDGLGDGVPHAETVAFVPIVVTEEDPLAAVRKIAQLRARGFGAVVPRFHVPIPNTREWAAMEAAGRLRPLTAACLAGADLAVDYAEWRQIDGPMWLERLRRDNRLPAGRDRRPSPVAPCSLRAVGTVLRGYVAHARRHSPSLHARQLVDAVVAACPDASSAIQTTDVYPFLAWNGESLLVLLERALERRVGALDGAPAPLVQAVRHALLTPGKRMRPVLLLAITGAHGLVPAVAMPAAVALEELHAASLVQDDLPCMDDDVVRRHAAAAHVRDGEGMALLASDLLVAMALEDVAGLAHTSAVGPARAANLVEAMAGALGPKGLVGGQARDLLGGRADASSLPDVLATHRAKTAPLFELAARWASILADVAEPVARQLVGLLGDLGVAFQIVDDALDATAAAPRFGRPAGSDHRRRLATVASILGPGPARRRAAGLLAQGFAPLADAPGADALARLARFVVERAR